MSAATRRGRWTYIKGRGWRLDGTGLVIDYDRLERTWYAMSGPKTAQPIDRYLDAAMEHVEGNTVDFLPAEEVRAMNSAAEIERRRLDDTGQWPKEFPDALGEFSTPFGAIVDGYQIREFGIWHRIDEPGEIDLELFRGSAGTFRNATAADAERVWRESVGELDLAGVA